MHTQGKICVILTAISRKKDLILKGSIYHSLQINDQSRSSCPQTGGSVPTSSILSMNAGQFTINNVIIFTPLLFKDMLN